eukprot:6073754-Prymnesium_polylepis.1
MARHHHGESALTWCQVTVAGRARARWRRTALPREVYVCDPRQSPDRLVRCGPQFRCALPERDPTCPRAIPQDATGHTRCPEDDPLLIRCPPAIPSRARRQQSHDPPTPRSRGARQQVLDVLAVRLRQRLDGLIGIVVPVDVVALRTRAAAVWAVGTATGTACTACAHGAPGAARSR